MLEGIQKRNRAIQRDIAETIQSLPEGAGAVERLTAHADFYASLDAAVALALRELNSSNDTMQGQQPVASKDLTDD